jgi:hypothetical protein
VSDFNKLFSAALYLVPNAWIDYRRADNGSVEWSCAAGNMQTNQFYPTIETAVLAFVNDAVGSSAARGEELTKVIALAKEALESFSSEGSKS